MRVIDIWTPASNVAIITNQRTFSILSLARFPYCILRIPASTQHASLWSSKVVHLCKERCFWHLQICIILIWKRHAYSIVHLLLVSVEGSLIDGDLGRSQSRGCDELQRRVSDQFSCEPKERFLKVVVGLGRDVVVLQVLLSVESDSLCLDLSLLHVDLVTAQNDGNVLANTDNITCSTLVLGIASLDHKYSRCQLGTFL